MNGALRGGTAEICGMWRRLAGGRLEIFSRYFAQASSELKDEMRKCIRIIKRRDEKMHSYSYICKPTGIFNCSALPLWGTWPG